MEDIACSIFQWKQGNYKFDTVPNVDKYQIENYSISADAVTMEAARRMDEWDRITQCFTKDTVFIHTDHAGPTLQNIGQVLPLDDFAEYLLMRIDGTSSTEFLCQESFFSDYQVFQTLFELLQDKKITPLPDIISSSINAALKRSDPFDMVTSKVLLSSIIAATFIASIYFIGTILFNGILFSKSVVERHYAQSELIRTHSNQKIAIATLQYQANYGTQPVLFSDLVKTGTIDKRDLANFVSSSIKRQDTEHLAQ